MSLHASVMICLVVRSQAARSSLVVTLPGRVTRASWPTWSSSQPYTLHAEMRDAKLIDVQDFFPEDSVKQPSYRTFREATLEFQRKYILATLEANDWDIAAAASQLDMTRSHLYNLINNMGLRKNDN